MSTSITGRPVRCPSKDPTPFLRDMYMRGFLYSARWTCCHASTPIVLDLGAGNLRNTLYLRSHGFAVTALDLHPVRRNVQLWRAGVDPLPAFDSSVSLVLCQYLLMFLDAREARVLLIDIHRVLMPGGLLLIELEDIKQGRKVHMHRVLSYLGVPERYKVIRTSRDKHCLIKKL